MAIPEHFSANSSLFSGKIRRFVNYLRGNVKNFILQIYDWLTAHKRVAALILLVILALSAVSALRLRYQEDISAFLPAQQREQLQNVDGQQRMAVLFRGGDLDQRLDAMYAFEVNWNEACPDIPVSAQAENSQVLEVFSFLSGNWPYFLQEADYARMDSLLAVPGYVEEALKQDKEALYGSSAIQERYMRADPLRLYSPVMQRFQGLNKGSRMEDGCLFTEDGETGIVLFDSPYGGSETGKNAELVQLLVQVKAQTAADFPEIDITSTGGPEVAVENAGRIKKDSILALALAAILICIVLWFSYKRVADVLWILISIAAGALFALGIIALFKSSVSLIVLGIGCTIIGIAVNYPLHYVDHLKYQPDKRKALAEQVNPLLVGNITTVGAFLSLLLLKADALHDFGFIGAMMLVGTILFVLVFLPVFVLAARKPRNAIKLDLDRHIHAGKTARRAFFAAFLVLTAFLWWQSTKVGFDADLHHINYMTGEQEDGFAVLESLRPDASVFPVPSADEQAERIERWNAFWKAHEGVSDQLIEAGLAEGFTAHAFQPFFDALDKDWQSQERAYFQPIDLEPESSAAAMLVESLQEDFNTVGLLCSLIVFIFLWISFGSLELSILSFLPLAVSWIWIQGIMGLTGLQFNIVNIVLATFIFGQGDDYSIFITEGLMYERATGKKILHSYKNAVMLSALIMFIGIGALVVARHPAMRSLGLVTVIGMFTVVLMAYYLPPLVYRWLTTKKGEPRKAPIGILRLIATGFIIVIMALSMTLLSAWAGIYFLFGKSERKRLKFHKLLSTLSGWAVRCIPGGHYKLYNPHGEDFSKPAVYICNHQSHLDVLPILALNPKLVFLTNDWAWNFPLYRAVVRNAEYYPTSWGLDKSSEHIKGLVERGYSIVAFVEGTRSMDSLTVQRFHRGPFLAAKELGLDVLPLCIHGFGFALPKHDFMLRRAGLSLEVGQRFRIPEEADIATVTKETRHFYNDWYADIRKTRETASYCAPYVKYQYLYKGHDARKECRQVLRKAVYEEIDALTGPTLELRNAGCGVYALLAALAHPEIQITAYEPDEDKYLTATRCQLPDNLKYINE